MRLQAVDAGGECRFAPLDMKLRPDFFSGLNEKVSGWIRAEVVDGDTTIHTLTEPISLLAYNQWCGLGSLPEILAAFVLPNDPAVMAILGRAAEVLREQTGRLSLNGYQDKRRKSAWEQLASIYRAVGELGIRYIVPPASFENSGQRVRLPSEILAQRFATCLDLSLLFVACCEQAGLNSLIVIHEAHAYAACWMEDKALSNPSSDDIQHIRKLATDELITAYECKLVTDSSPGSLVDAERLAQPHLQTDKPFDFALDIRQARQAGILPLPVLSQGGTSAQNGPDGQPFHNAGMGNREFAAPLENVMQPPAEAGTRVDQWKSQLLDLSLRNRLLKFRETKSTVCLLFASPHGVERELAAGGQLSLEPKPRVMGEGDPRSATVYIQQQRSDAVQDHLVGALKDGRLHTHLEDPEHSGRLTEIFRSARRALEENGSNTLFAAIGFLEWRETEQSDQVNRAPLLLRPVELVRKSLKEGFVLQGRDEETLLNVTLVEKLRRDFQMEIPIPDPLPLAKDQSGVDVERVFRIFREAVRDLRGWEVRSEIWLGQFSFAKFLLWKDLADRRGELCRNRVVNHLINQAGRPYPNPAGDIRPEQLDGHFHPRDILCPLSADSTQLAAAMAAAAGNDLIIEGPPGTGKSQTITNIIAHCLAQGKSILFVAEKRAALDVVYRRLKEQKLEPFCLELHSNRAGKGDVLAQFDRSLCFRPSDDPTVWESQAGELQRLRDTLNVYASTLHRRYKCGLSAYQCIDYLLPRQHEIALRLDAWPSILNTPLEALGRAREAAVLLQQRSSRAAPLADHPLAALHCEEYLDRTRDEFVRLGELAGSAADTSRDARAWFLFPDSPATKADTDKLTALVESLVTPEPVGANFATAPWSKLSADIGLWISLVRRRGELRTELAVIHKVSIQGSNTLACEAWSPGEAEDIFTQCQQAELLAKRAIDVTKKLCHWVKFPRAAATRSDIRSLLALADSLLVPFPVAGHFVMEPWQKWAADIDRWIELVRQRDDLRARLPTYNERKIIALDLDMLIKKWRAAQGSHATAKWWRITNIRRRLRMASLKHTRPDEAVVDEVLQTASQLRAVNQELAAVGSRAANLLGRVWNLGEPQLDQLCQARDWGAELHQRLTVLAGGDAEWLSRLRELVAKLLSDGPATYAIGTTSGDRLSHYRDAISKFDAMYQVLSVSAALDIARLDNATDYLSSVAAAFSLLQQSALELRVINGELNAASLGAQESLGATWAHGEPSVEALSKAQAWGKLLHARMLTCAGGDSARLGSLRQLLASLFREGPAAYASGTTVRDRLLHYLHAQLELNTALSAVAAKTCLNRSAIDTAPDYFGAVYTLAERVSGSWRQMKDWCLWREARHEGIRLGLAPVIAELESGNCDPRDIPALFEGSFRRCLLNAIIESEPTLRRFSGMEHGDLIGRFREVDKQMATSALAAIRARIAEGIPGDDFTDDDSAAQLTLLRREIAKKRRHMPVRQLLARIPQLLPRLKPCLLMSPLSVAQFLDPSHPAFDVVIFDEASQIPVWDAIGAIARGNQLIVVGDPKQLPPTNFFKSVDDDEDISGPDEFKDLESILDELMSHGLRRKRLKWHYRSRHEGLIAFSNRQYYGNELHTFPSAEAVLGGVRMKHLPEARYDKGKSRTNRVEAEALVKELIKQLRSSEGRRRSYGVVTFSIAQQRLIEDLLDEERSKHPEVEAHFGDDPPLEGEPVFVKNLESVQGDERDVIYFSICYGPDETGRVGMRFGPLNRDGGERRLNVAITRAKHELVVFSGLRAGQMDLTRTRARGVRDLKYFLDYAERGQIALAAATSASTNADPDSEFEQLVANRLREAGCEVHHQVGCSGCRIDLGILDPERPGRYLLGVECDGATYHRSATARDRDKLRQLVLEDLGWTLYRVWSTDWWHDSDKETGKLLSFIKQLSSGKRAS